MYDITAPVFISIHQDPIPVVAPALVSPLGALSNPGNNSKKITLDAPLLRYTTLLLAASPSVDCCTLLSR